MKNNIIAALGGLAIISVASILSLSSVFATNTNTSQDNVAVSVPVSCTMNGTGMTSHNANIPNGTYQADIGTTTLKTFCNDNQGFAIYAIGYTNEEYGNTTLIGATGGQTIVTGTATTTGSPDVSNWAVKLATDSTATYPITLDNSFGAYSSVPSTYTKVAHRDSGTDLGSSATGASLTTTYAAYISKTQQADTYNGKVKFTLVHPASEEPPHEIACEARRICYNANTATALGEMGKQSRDDNDYAIAPGFDVTLWAPNFKRDGYGFAGWNTEYDYSGTTYGPQQTIDVPANIATDGLGLYAMWIKSAGTLQNWNGCSGMSVGDVTALTDNRDNNTYAVAKLADNKCWMIENLRLDNSSELSAINTHNPSLPLINSWWYNSSNDSDAKPTSNHLSATTDPTQIAWCQTDSLKCDDQSMLATNNTTLFNNNAASSYSASSSVYGYGNYYNWYSATVGHGKHIRDYDGGYTVSGDICPVGWHLPTGANLEDGAGEFDVLDSALGGPGVPTYSADSGMAASRAHRSFPNNLVYSGYVNGSLVGDRNSSGLYWSASMNSDSYDALSFYFHYAYVDPGTNTDSSEYEGGMIRCIAGN